MNIKSAYTYDIGLDIGTNSIGWSVTDEDGKLLSCHRRPTMGVRLFKAADTAEGRRMKRGSRRRMERTKMRVYELQRIFAPMIAEVDSEFYMRLKEAELISSDRTTSAKTCGLFVVDEYADADYHRDFPTIFHLRDFLMHSDDKQDIRLVYLALHNIMKHRGNFLREDNKTLSARNANPYDALCRLKEALANLTESLESSTFMVDIDVDAANDLLTSDDVDVKQFAGAFSCCDYADDDGALTKKSKISTALARACLGRKVNNVCDMLPSCTVLSSDGSPLSLDTSNSDDVESVMDALDDDVLIEVVSAVASVYNASILYSLLDGSESISAALVKKYERHHDELTWLKRLFKKYCTSEEYNLMFRGETFVNPMTGKRQYRASSVTGYTQYIESPSAYGKAKNKSAQDALISDIKAIFNKHPEIYDDEGYKQISKAIESGTLLSKPRSTDNGTIPYQLNLEEALAIIDHQGKFYSQLMENRQHIADMISKRIPYYVGPLHANSDGRSKNAWSVRLDGHENDSVFPWNYEEAIDIDASAELFIRRMTGKCTYLYGEDVLPRHSLLYSEFCLRNELNCAKFADGGGKPHRLNNADDRQLIIDRLFKRRKKVNNNAICNFLKCEMNYQNPSVTGTQSSNGFESKLESYNDYRKIFGVDDLTDAPLKFSEIEEIILWQTTFEDKQIVERKVSSKYGERLTDEQISMISRKRYKGWGRLSKKLLSGIRTTDDEFGKSIIQIMRDDKRARTFQEIVTDDRLGIKDAIASSNAAFESDESDFDIEELRCSPNTKRGIRQALKIIDEIIDITGKTPRSINIEVTRDDQKKGKRTISRKTAIDQMCKVIKSDIDSNSNLKAEIERSGIDVDDDRLFLYVSQNGKDMYTGERLNINELGSYQIDHIIPRSLIKDDSIDNKVLVRQSSNQRKGNRLGIDAEIVTKMHGFWKLLAKNGLITKRKLQNLELNVDDRNAIGRFINRQLVETAAIVRHVREICQSRYPETVVVSVKASLSSNIRRLLDLPKCRTLNHYHHAHDALLATTAVRFIQAYFPYLYDDGEFRWTDNAATQYLYAKIRKSLNGNDTSGYQIAGYIVGNFDKTLVDTETGEVLWDAAAEVDGLKRAFSYGNIFITHKPVINYGQLYDETLYSPYGDKKPSIAQKASGALSKLSVYGGYRGVKYSYYSAVLGRNKKGKLTSFLIRIPTYLLDSKTHDVTDEKIIGYIGTIMSDYSDVSILIPKIPMYTQVEIGGHRYWLGGTKNNETSRVIPAEEISASLINHEKIVMSTIAKIESDVTYLSDECDYVTSYDILRKKIHQHIPILISSLDDADTFTSYNHERQCKALMEIASKSSGQVSDNKAISLNKIDAIIFQSVTGMHERYVRI